MQITFRPERKPPKRFGSSSLPRGGNGPCTRTAPSVSDRRRRARRTRRRSSRPSHRTVREPSRIRVLPAGTDAKERRSSTKGTTTATTRRRRVRTTTRRWILTAPSGWNLAETSRRVALPWVGSSAWGLRARTRVAAWRVRICRRFAVVSWRLKISTTRLGSSASPNARRWRTWRRPAALCGAEWDDIVRDRPETRARDLLRYCFSASLIVATLHDAMGVPLRDASALSSGTRCAASRWIGRWAPP